MNRFALALLMQAAWHCAGAAQQAEQPPGAGEAPMADGWFLTYAPALARAHEEKRPLLVVFGADWCGPCKALERSTLHDRAVLPLLAQCVRVHVDIDRESAVAFAWRTGSIPRTVLLNLHDQVIMDRVGYLPPEEFAQALGEALAGAATLLSEGEAVKAPVTPEARDEGAVRRRLEDAGDAGAAAIVAEMLGEFEPALRKRNLEVLAPQVARLRPALAALLDHEHLAVRVGAWEALRTIDAIDAGRDPWLTRAERRAAMLKLYPQAEQGPEPLPAERVP